MRSFGAFEAKTHFAALLDRMASGEHISTMRHGRPVARRCRSPEQAERRKELRDLHAKSLQQRHPRHHDPEVHI